LAFDVILGKPWLEEVDAMHHYKTDTITINTSTTQIVIDNKERTANTIPDPAPTSSIVPEDRPIDNIPTTEKTLDELLAEEAVRIDTLHRTQDWFAESRWAKYLDVDEMEDEEPASEE
jgi:hypothetical protein